MIAQVGVMGSVQAVLRCDHTSTGKEIGSLVKTSLHLVFFDSSIYSTALVQFVRTGR